MLLNSFSTSVGVVAAQTLWKALSNVRRIPSSCGSGVAIRFVPYGVGSMRSAMLRADKAPGRQPRRLVVVVGQLQRGQSRGEFLSRFNRRSTSRPPGQVLTTS